MNNLQTSVPFTVLYRGNLQDTALLVGLAHSQANVGLIAFTGELTNRGKEYYKLLSRWLQNRGLPGISIHPTLSGTQLERLLSSPLKSWGWGNDECRAVIRLSNLPFPPASESLV